MVPGCAVTAVREAAGSWEAPPGLHGKSCHHSSHHAAVLSQEIRQVQRGGALYTVNVKAWLDVQMLKTEDLKWERREEREGLSLTEQNREVLTGVGQSSTVCVSVCVFVCSGQHLWIRLSLWHRCERQKMKKSRGSNRTLELFDLSLPTPPHAFLLLSVPPLFSPLISADVTGTPTYTRHQIY